MGLFNVVWFVFFGWLNALLVIILSGIMAITIIGYPIAKSLIPIAQEQKPNADEDTPVAQELRPNADESTPVAFATRPNADARVAVAQE